MENSKKRKFKVSTIPIIAFLIALEIIFTRFISINTPIVRIGFAFVPVSLCGIMYGPLWSGAAYAVGDLLGMAIFPTGPYFPGFTVTAFLTGLTFGIFLHGKEITWKTVLPASLLVCIFLNLGLDTLWLYITMGQGVWGLLPARLTKTALMIPLQIIIIPFIWKRIGKLIEKRLIA